MHVGIQQGRRGPGAFLPLASPPLSLPWPLVGSEWRRKDRWDFGLCMTAQRRALQHPVPPAGRGRAPPRALLGLLLAVLPGVSPLAR